MTTFLDLDDLITLTRLLDAGPVRDVGLLDSAVARPRSTVFGAPAYPSTVEKAAALLHSITSNHALVDGNKRLAWLACTVFLDLNGQRVTLSDDEAFTLVMDIAGGELRDIDEIAQRLRTEPR
ncbi:death-on-curing protein [Knoellia remsis]|uniref:Death-on-curing protein n=1 Tax=Knoellia remsis TaxID=407159 RepID=A0A2T0UCJ4_9MICO|nr:type II toxin-antitoxin system death-on-curing family toxin [Knoellia remsis]PRY55643.1 death-on-curing protein [Knoellia remsis]